MATYKVEVPKHSTKRMNKNKLIVIWGDNWNGFKRKEYNLSGCEKDFIFELDDKFEFEGTTSKIDGPIFYVEVEYSNSTGSRKDSEFLIPVKGD